jgi:hypothetical protein
LSHCGANYADFGEFRTLTGKVQNRHCMDSFFIRRFIRIKVKELRKRFSSNALLLLKQTTQGRMTDPKNENCIFPVDNQNFEQKKRDTLIIPFWQNRSNGVCSRESMRALHKDLFVKIKQDIL